jgi:ferredoxin
MDRKIIRKKHLLSLLGITIILIFLIGSHYAQDRFPRPQFESDYQRPLTTTPGPHARFFEIFDIFVLAGAIGLASFFALKKRSRRGIFWLTVFSALYFGFYRDGCVCAVGSVQNVSAALLYPEFILPIGVIAFFVLPLIFTLFFGRTFCAAVCPLGCMQDLVMLKPVKVPKWLSEVLSLFPYIYLGLAVLFAATGSVFIICKYDPFISIYRMSNDFGTILYSAGFLGLCVFIGRPYCRFLCPYGVLLGWMSSLAKHRVTITPDACVQCRLCEDTCPFDQIEMPASDKIPEGRSQRIKQLAMLVVIVPVIVFASSWSLSKLDVIFARMHPTVGLAEEIFLEDSGVKTTTSLETQTFRSQGTPTQELMEQAKEIQKQFNIGGWLLGGFLGLVFAFKLIKLSVLRPRIDYEVNKVSCYSCARCFEYCPNEHVRLENMKKDILVENKEMAN